MIIFVTKFVIKKTTHLKYKIIKFLNTRVSI
jgi:hypothetical protein